MISQRKWRALNEAMKKLGILEADLKEQFIIASGSGGQKLHKTASCVHLQHAPTGITIRCQESRSRDENRFYARRRLYEKIEEQTLKEKSKRQQAIEKIRQQKRRRSRRAKQKILADKSHRSNVKARRQSPRNEE